MIFSIFCALTAGTAKVLSRSVNSKLSGKTGLLKSTFFNFVSGLLFSIILIISFHKPQLAGSRHFELWMLLGGVISVSVVFLLSYSLKAVSSVNMTVLLFIGQMSTGLILDFAVNNVFVLNTFIGIIVIGIGLIIQKFI